jgi:putative nucleotidyltransferase with HDIG domain
MGIPDKILDGIDRLEPLPITVQKLLVALNNAEVDFSEITEAIEYDGAITSNILRTANSAAYVRVEHIRDAVVRLGTVTLLDIMLIGHLRSLRITAPHYSLSENDLWLHGATASLAVKAIIKETHNRKIPEASTIAALIHDIGKLILARYLSTDGPDIRNLCQEKSISFVEAEKEIFGCDHAEVGGAIARKWSFPELITEAIERHHDLSPGEHNLMLDAVILANLAANNVGAQAEPDGIGLSPDFAGSNQRIGLTEDGFVRVCTQTDAWMQELKQSYGLTQ